MPSSFFDTFDIDGLTDRTSIYQVQLQTVHDFLVQIAEIIVYLYIC